MKEKILKHRFVVVLFIGVVLAGSAGYLTLKGRSTTDGNAAQLPPRRTDTPSPTITPSKIIPVTPSPTLTPTIIPTEPLATGLSPIDGMEMVFVPEGPFLMGLSDENVEYIMEMCGSDCRRNSFQSQQPQHEVYLDSYWIDRTEVTNEMYAAFLNQEGNQTFGDGYYIWLEEEWSSLENVEGEWIPKSGYADHPVEAVSWYGARAYCAWAGRRLPTEAEWEKAARGEDGRLFPWGNDFNRSLFNTKGYGASGTMAVGSFPGNASPYGALDMLGNVEEWVADLHDKEYYAVSPAVNPTGPYSENAELYYWRVLRGGSYYFINQGISAAYRQGAPGFDNLHGVGFRCVSIAGEIPVYATSTPVQTPMIDIGETIALDWINMMNETDGWGRSAETILNTRDGGQTWRETSPPENSEEYVEEFDKRLYFEAVDADHAWVVYAPKPSAANYDYGCVPSDAQVWHTSDGGQTWDPSQPLMHDVVNMSCRASIYMSDTQTGWLSINGWYTAAGLHTEMQLFKTTDGGNTWETVEASWCYSEDLCVSYAPWLSEKAFYGQSGWSLENMHGCYPCYGNTPSPAYFVTTDGGTTWHYRYLPSPTGDPDFYEGYFFCEPYQLTLSTDKIVHLQLSCYQYEGDASPGPKPGPKDYVYASEDGGLTWTIHELPSSSGRMLFFDKYHGLLLDREMWRTEDGGSTWEHINTVTWDGQFSFIDPWYGWAVTESEEGETALVATTNGGETWKILTPVEAE